MSRKTDKNFEGSFRLVLETRHRRTGELLNTQYVGPYQTKGAAKGQLTSQLHMLNDSWYYREPETVSTGWVERSTGWEAIEIAD